MWGPNAKWLIGLVGRRRRLSRQCRRRPLTESNRVVVLLALGLMGRSWSVSQTVNFRVSAPTNHDATRGSPSFDDR